jgi:hypothetical protein
MNPQTNNVNSDDSQQLTEEQVQKIRQEAVAFYDEEIPFLEKQASYERLIADIEESRLKRLKAIIQYAQINSAMHDAEQQSAKENLTKEETKGNLEEERPVRKLATE